MRLIPASPSVGKYRASRPAVAFLPHLASLDEVNSFYDRFPGITIVKSGSLTKEDIRIASKFASLFYPEGEEGE